MDYESRTGTAERNANKSDVDINCCSNTECTGLIPSAPQSKAEIEHYGEVYHYLPEHAADPETCCKQD